MRFTPVPAGDPAAVARAAHGPEPFVLLLRDGCVPHSDAFGGLRASLDENVGVLGGATHAGGVRRFGWMLAPAPFSPLPFDLVAVEAPLGEAGVDALVRGPIDAVAPEMMLVRRELLREPLPADAAAAAVALCARARAAGLHAICRPAFACAAPLPDRDDRGRVAALRAVSALHPELRGVHRSTAAARRLGVERETRIAGGVRARIRRRTPATTVLVHGPGAGEAARRARDLAPAVVTARAVDDAADALRAALRVRGDRYVLVAAASSLPDAAAFDALTEAIEATEHVAFAAPHAELLDGGCVLIAAGRLPQHVEAGGETIAAAMASLVDGAVTAGRAVRAPGFACAPRPRPSRDTMTLIVLAGSSPDVTKTSFDRALATTRVDDEVVAVCAAGSDVTRRMFGAYDRVRVELDHADPLLSGAANAAIGAARGDLIVLLADDVLVSASTFDRLRSAFSRIPALGAALPCVGGAPGAEGVHDVTYRDLENMREFAERRAVAFAREAEPIDDASTPVLAIAREAFAAVGGIDPAFGPTRRGIADLVLRLRAAGYAVVRCEDAYAHRFPAEQSRNPAAASQQGGVSDAAARAAAVDAGFDPARRVPFSVPRAVAPRTARTAVVIVAVADAAELDRAASFLGRAAQTFDAASPVRVHVVLDGAIPTSDAVARVRDVLATGGRPIDETVTVRVERAADLAAWRVTLPRDLRTVVAAGHERDALADCPSVAAHALGELLRPVILR